MNHLISSRRTAAALICRFSSGIDSTKQSPRFVKHSRPTSVWRASFPSTDVFCTSPMICSCVVLSNLDGVFVGLLFACNKLGGTTQENVANAILRTRAPSCAVNLYFVTGRNCGNENTLNCSSDAIRTRCGAVPGPDNSSGTPA